MDKKILDQQSQHWENNFRSKPEMFGLEPSNAAIRTLKNFKEKKINKIVELGAGLGRDTIFFAKNSIFVEALDYSKTSIESIKSKSKKKSLSNFIDYAKQQNGVWFATREEIARDWLSIDG